MDAVWQFLVSVGITVALVIGLGVVFASLPDRWQRWVSRRRGALAAGIFLLVATAAMGLGVAILVAGDHLGAASPADAYVVGPFVMALGLAMGAFAVAAYRNNRPS